MYPIALLLSGLFGLGFTQTAHLNVLVPALAPTTMLRRAAGGSCDITLTFLDGQSNVLKTDEVSIDPGQSASLEFDRDDVKDSKSFRKQPVIYAEVQTTTDSGNCPTSAVVDITDPNGNTEAVIPLTSQNAAL